MTARKQLSAGEVENLVDRLSRKKEPPSMTKDKANSGPSLSKEEAEQLFERLSAPRKMQSAPVSKKTNANQNLTNEEIDQFFERLSQQKKAVSPPPIKRGEKRSQMDIDRITERLSVVKSSDEVKDARSNNVKLSKKGIQELVSRLSNKEIALEKTPESKRVLNSKFGIVSSYAWSGNNHQAILCNEESP